MKPPPFLLLASSFFLAGAVRGAETFDEAMKRAASNYDERLRKAAIELNGARERIAGEKAPLLQEMRSAEDRIVTAEAQIERLQTGQEETSGMRRKLLMDLDSTRKSTTYMGTLAHDGLAGFEGGLSPGEGQMLSDRIQALGQELDETSAGPSGRAAVDVAEFLLERTQRALGGYSAQGMALVSGDNQVYPGVFAFVGPETYFQADEGTRAGVVRPRSGSIYPVAYPVPGWSPAGRSQFFQGQLGSVIADSSGGRALRLRETRGTLLEHIQKGGLVAYVIIATGLLALVMIAQKVRDLSLLAPDPPEVVRAFLSDVARGDLAKAELASRTLRRTTRELFQAGLQFSESPKDILEEHLQSVLLEQRLHFERRLQMLAVIATAAPLMGLLGTVIGMVKTFALITVFGTGNAGKLASGISQVLVATELGLVVAIPTLIAHGFLAQRIQRNLSLLERYALEFVTAVETSRAAEESVST
jgi:biopolymer transport protein ExbB